MRLNLPIRVAALVVAIGVLIPAAAFSVSQTVTIQSFAFRPQTVTINAGDTITWTNADPLAHTATSDTGAFDTGTIPAGGSKLIPFAVAGRYAYHCSIHPAMTGTIVVLGAAQTPAPSTPRPTPPPTVAPPTIAPPATSIAPAPSPSASPSPSPPPSPSPSPSSSATPSPSPTATGTPIALPTVTAAGPSAIVAAAPALAGGPGPLLAAGGVALAVVLAGSAFYLSRRR